MAVLVVANVSGQTSEKYDRLIEVLEPELRRAKGFIAHGAGPLGSSWQTFEVWDTVEDATRFFAVFVHPNLPEGVTPKRTVVELHALVRAQG